MTLNITDSLEVPRGYDKTVIGTAVVAGVVVCIVVSGSLGTGIFYGTCAGVVTGGIVGYLLANGCKYTEFSEDPFTAMETDDNINTRKKRAKLRELIQNMTLALPEKFLSAEQVVTALKEIIGN